MRQVLSSVDLSRSIRRLATEILESTQGLEDLRLVGIRTGGVYLAQRLSRTIGELEGACPVLGEMDITLYRDDLYTGLEKPTLGDTRIPFAVDGARVVLVDDVLFTGRTVRAALGLLMDYGRPDWIKLAVLVDRGGRELPIHADFVGRRIETDKGDRVTVSFVEDGSEADGIFVG
ncbi:MAG TPA: bifunctional pyr operon transcriptional regulator/uracil phosphoribosyltransferase PyrR [Myxococcota bacterium]|nr:bifunctional pyr operon transcriptional regulator/uracil phosphoribosyltransferase PyrR [Myxococcota bacterium]